MGPLTPWQNQLKTVALLLGPTMAFFLMVLHVVDSATMFLLEREKKREQFISELLDSHYISKHKEVRFPAPKHYINTDIGM